MTLTDARGAALKGIAVDWHSELGTIRSGITDPEGVLTAEYFPGTVLGTDRLYFSLSLLEPEWAVSIDVIAHAESMNFPTGLMSPVPTEVVPLGQEITLYATMVDQYGNLGANMLVGWAWEVETDPEERPTIRPKQGFTNQQGQTTVYITSDFSGEFEVGIRSLASGKGTVFEPIRFGGHKAAPTHLNKRHRLPPVTREPLPRSKDHDIEQHWPVAGKTSYRVA